MLMRTNEKVLQELQMLTGVVSNDMEYLFHLLQSNTGVVEKQQKVEFVKPEPLRAGTQIQALEDWFNNL